MRLRSFWRCALEVRCALLPDLDSLHYFRSRSGVPVSVGDHAGKDRLLRVLVDDGVSGRADRRFYLRVAQRRPGLGVRIMQKIPRGDLQDTIVRAATDELQD